MRQALASMTITIKTAGLLSSIQDNGRRGFRHLGIPWSGCISPVWQKVANTLVGNDPEQSIIECWEGGLQFDVGEFPIRLAVCAHQSLKMTIQDSATSPPVKISPWQSYTAPAHSSVGLSTTGDFRHAIIAIYGLSVAPQLGSTSTYAKASLGGLSGTALQQQDQLTVEPAPVGPEHSCSTEFQAIFTQTEIRVVLGPQQNNFSAKGIQNLLNGRYEVGVDADRMGVRLKGPEVEHKDEASKDIVSDAIVPGSIQVPGSGQPIVLLSDAHTAGGYAPKFKYQRHLMPMLLNLNADLGESFGPWPMGDDANLLQVVNSANVACGFHAGDPLVMAKTIETAKQAKVSIGAHPGYPDLQGFGRRIMSLPDDELAAMLQYQLAALDGMSQMRGLPITHIKPHGALNNQACEDKALADIIVNACKSYNPDLIFLAPVLSELAQAANEASLNVALEVFADRRYADNGSLVSRRKPHAVIDTADECIQHVFNMIDSGGVVTESGKILKTDFHSICVHGDNRHAVDSAKLIKQALLDKGHQLKPLTEIIINS